MGALVGHELRPPDRSELGVDDQPDRPLEAGVQTGGHHEADCRGAHRLILSHRGRLGAVSIVKINAITVAADSGDELAHRFAARAGAVDDQPGFEGFELLKPTDDRTTWLVVTRWRDETAFEAWVGSASFVHGHRSAAERAGADAPAPVGQHSEIWSYEPAGGSPGRTAT